MHRYYIFEGLFVLLGLALVASVLKYPKDILITLPLGILKRVLLGPFHGLFDSDTNKDDKPYPSKEKLNVDFNDGEKLIFVISTNKSIEVIIDDFLKVLTGNYLIDEFSIVTREKQAIVKFPNHINFYDFHFFVQHFNDELGNEKSFGVFKSYKLDYFVFQDRETLNNLIGFTSDKKYFSIYMLDNLDENQYLKLNQKLKINRVWVEQYYNHEVFK